MCHPSVSGGERSFPHPNRLQEHGCCRGTPVCRKGAKTDQHTMQNIFSSAQHGHRGQNSHQLGCGRCGPKVVEVLCMGPTTWWIPCPCPMDGGVKSIRNLRAQKRGRLINLSALVREDGRGYRAVLHPNLPFFQRSVVHHPPSARMVGVNFMQGDRGQIMQNRG
jgi:hypothetical protein